MLKPSNSVVKRVVPVIVGLIIFILVVPLPFKPSLWSYFHGKRLSSELNKSTEAVYLPTGEDRNHATFETFIGWRDAYFIRYGNASTNELAAYYQFSDTSKFPLTSEGPSEDDLAPYAKILKDEGCVIKEADLYICKYVPDGRQFLMRKISGKRLIAGISQAWPNHQADFVYKVSDEYAKAAERILKSVTPLELKDAKEKYFRPSF